MRIYTFRTSPGQAYLVDAADNGDRCEPDPPRLLASAWVVPEFELVVSDEFEQNRLRCDFPSHLPTVCMLSERAARVLSPVLIKCGELLPIRVVNDAGKFYLFNVTRVINAVDMVRSKFMPLPSGAIGPCERLVFARAQIPDDALFFRSTQMGPVSVIFATERAAQAVRDTSLIGYDFPLAWSDEPGVTVDPP